MIADSICKGDMGMSQAKVDKYKKQKANRKEIMKKEKMQRRVRSTIAGVVCLVLVSWVGYSMVVSYQDSQPRDVVSVDYSQLETYMNEINQ